LQARAAGPENKKQTHGHRAAASRLAALNSLKEYDGQHMTVIRHTDYRDAFGAGGSLYFSFIECRH
jgi:hypothetical protein